MTTFSNMLQRRFIPTAEWPLTHAQLDDDVILCNHLSEKAFCFTLDNAPYILFEPTLYAAHDINDALVHPALPDALFLLTTQSCYHAPVAEWLSGALRTHYRLNESLSMDIRTVLQEAIANAVIHGNLGVHGRFEDVKVFDNYYAHLHMRLHAQEYGASHVAVAVMRQEGGLTLSVSDEGNGYPQGSISEHNNGFPLGQGLLVIRELCSSVRVLRGGSTIEMRFTLP